MKITKAKYNWLVAQYNYRKNKEEIIEISDEEYERLTGKSIINETPNIENNPIVRFILFLNDLPEIKSGINTPGLFYAVENVIINNSNNPISSIRIYDGMGYYNEHPLSHLDEQEKIVFNSNRRIVFGQSASGIFCAYLVDIRMRFITTNIIQIGDNQYDLNNGICISNENEQGLYNLRCEYDGTYLRIGNY